MRSEQWCIAMVLDNASVHSYQDTISSSHFSWRHSPSVTFCGNHSIAKIQRIGCWEFGKCVAEETYVRMHA